MIGATERSSVGGGAGVVRRRRNFDPVREHRRRMIFQSVGLAVLAVVAVILVVMALQVP